MPLPYTYSFLDTVCTIIGPNGAFPLGQGAGVDEGGITVEMREPKNTMKIGADGTWMHSLHAGKGGKVTVRLLKNSPTNALLSAMYNADTSNPSAHGQNIIQVNQLTSLDEITTQGCAFLQQPTVTYDKEGPMLEWTWDAGQVDMLLGAGVTSI